jgi:L-ascorbate metabolism protein UlaG (beta-lactamase superfamily)
MLQPVKSGRALIEEIDRTIAITPTLWWLGHAGFVMRFANITFYIDPCLSDPPGRTRRMAAPLTAGEVRHADMIFVTHEHAGHLDAETVKAILEGSKSAKLALPRSAVEKAHAAGIPYERMASTDSPLRIEYFKDNLYGRVYSVPSAHPELDWTQTGGYPYLGYLIRFGRWTVYHAGDCTPYPDLAARLRPFNVSVALLPIGEGNFTPSEAAQLASDIGAEWVVPMHHGTFLERARTTELGEAGPVRAPHDDPEGGFVTHMLGHRPQQRFKVLQCGEKWTVPEE